MASTLTHREWMALATEEYRRLEVVLSALPVRDWDAPTDCSGWTVRDVVAHLAGSAHAAASVREQLRQQRHGGRHKGDGLQLDAVNALQVSERGGLTSQALRQQLSDMARRAVRARTRMPAPVRALRLPFPPPLGRVALGFLTDVVYTRDAWMHRIDICRATGQPLELTAEHDGKIVADAARAWQSATAGHGLVLTGPAGCKLAGSVPQASYDAIEFARALSGRTRLEGVGADVVLF